MKIDVQEITRILKQEIRPYEARLDMAKVGRVLQVGDGIARICGLKETAAGEMLLFENDTLGEVFNWILPGSELSWIKPPSGGWIVAKEWWNC